MTHNSDIVIIGGGVAGLTAAAELAGQVTVTLCEAEDHLAYHASGRSAAMFLASYGNATIRALNDASAAAHHAGAVLKQRPFMLLAGPDDADAFARETTGFGMDRIGTGQARQLFPLLDPARTPFVALREDTYDLDTDLLIQNARRKATAAGARIVTSARVTAIARDNGWHLQTTAGDLKARVLVNAAGAWADQIAAMAGVAPLGLTPYRRSMARLPLPGGMDPTGWPFVDAVHEAWYAKPDAGQLIVSPSEEDPMPPMDAWADDMVIAEGLGRFSDMTGFDVTRITATWAGLRTFAPDRTLVIGRDPVAKDFVWLAGQGGYGFQTAPAASRLCAACVTGDHPDLPAAIVAALDPKRFTA